MTHVPRKYEPDPHMTPKIREQVVMFSQLESERRKRIMHGRPTGHLDAAMLDLATTLIWHLRQYISHPASLN